MKTNIRLPEILTYISGNDFVFQQIDGLIELWSEADPLLRNNLLRELKTIDEVIVINKKEASIFFNELAQWAFDSDLLVQVDHYLLCIPDCDKFYFS